MGGLVVFMLAARTRTTRLALVDRPVGEPGLPWGAEPPRGRPLKKCEETVYAGPSSAGYAGVGAHPSLQP